jgi:hypothetical protein
MRYSSFAAVLAAGFNLVFAHPVELVERSSFMAPPRVDIDKSMSSLLTPME